MPKRAPGSGDREIDKIQRSMRKPEYNPHAVDAGLQLCRASIKTQRSVPRRCFTLHDHSRQHHFRSGVEICRFGRTMPLWR